MHFKRIILLFSFKFFRFNTVFSSMSCFFVFALKSNTILLSDIHLLKIPTALCAPISSFLEQRERVKFPLVNGSYCLNERNCRQFTAKMVWNGGCSASVICQHLKITYSRAQPLRNRVQSWWLDTSASLGEVYSHASFLFEAELFVLEGALWNYRPHLSSGFQTADLIGRLPSLWPSCW